jgi:hypothetical protein
MNQNIGLSKEIEKEIQKTKLRFNGRNHFLEQNHQKRQNIQNFEIGLLLLLLVFFKIKLY